MTEQEAMEALRIALHGSTSFVHVDPVREVATSPNQPVEPFLSFDVYYAKEDGILGKLSVRGRIVSR